MRGIVFALVLGLLLSGCTFFGEQPEQCGSEASYVCGSDGNTYTNACYARQAGVTVAYEGRCTQQPNQTSDQCLDSDNGKNALEAGVITKGTVRYEDSCASTAAVFEYYCTANEIESERVSCPEGSECSGGRCTSPACIDSDEGQAANVLGTIAKGTERYTDECTDENTVKEYYCTESGTIASTRLACGSGRVCSDGLCAEIMCTDSDGGMDIFERGTVREGGGVYTDYCSGTSSVKEYYCSGDTMVQTTSTCGDEFYCSDGRCVEYTCRDDDGGSDEDEFGIVSKGSESWEDDCYDSDTVKEYYCDGNEVKYERIGCGSSESCSGGECVRISCTDSDGGSKRAVFGTVTVGGSSYPDYCIDIFNLREYFCSGSGMDYGEILCTGYSELCHNNVCSPAHCEDSDGRDEHVAGSARIYTDNGYSDTQSDRCIDTRIVGEKYCSDLKISEARITCEADEVCSGAMCVEATCTDSDGGKNWIVPGTTTKGTDSATDRCDAMDPVDIYEYYCSGNEIRYEVHTCPDGCRTNADGIGYCNPL